MADVVEISNVTFAYEREPILENITFRMEKSDFLAIIGPNGGGKSTFLKLLVGLLTPQQGTIKIFGESPKNIRGKLGYVPQNTHINTDFPIRVLDVVLMGYREGKRPLFGYNDIEHRRAKEALEKVGLSHRLHAKIGALSGGERQRVMIARALCGAPKLLILDEPTSSLDIQGQRSIYTLLKHLNREIPVIVVSHDISVILEYADKVAYINRRLTFHDISDKNRVFHTHGLQEHFCEVELLQMLGADSCNECNAHKHDTKETP